MTFELARPTWLFLLASVPAWWLLTRRGGPAGLIFARADAAQQSRALQRAGRVIALLPKVLRVATMGAVVLALAGIQNVDTIEEEVRTELSVAIVLDLSSSMQAEDMGERRSRLEIVKERAARFAEGRPRDRMGLVVFAGEPLIRVPMTDDPRVVAAAARSLSLGLVSDGTDIASAVLTGTYLLRDELDRARVLMLLTDGAHNTQGLAPSRAAATAAAAGIRIYAISVGNPDSDEDGTNARTGPDGEELETVLMQATRLSGGRYYLAQGAAALDSIYREIDRLEQVSMELRSTPIRIPQSRGFLVLALVLLLVEWALRGSRLGVIP